MATLELDGWGNGYAPDEETKETEFESNDLNECLDYAKETGNFEPIENAIYLFKKNKELLKECLYATPQHNTYVRRRLSTILNQMK